VLASSFCAIIRRCQASSVSGVTIVLNSINTFRPSLCLRGQSALVVSEAHSFLAQLLPQDPNLRPKVVSEKRRTFIPTGQSDHDNRNGSRRYEPPVPVPCGGWVISL
jgi:hypothetical protein